MFLIHQLYVSDPISCIAQLRRRRVNLRVSRKILILCLGSGKGRLNTESKAHRVSVWVTNTVCLIDWLVGFLTSSSNTRPYRGRVPRQSVRQFYVLPQMRQSWETMTSVSAGHHEHGCIEKGRSYHERGQNIRMATKEG